MESNNIRSISRAKKFFENVNMRYTVYAKQFVSRAGSRRRFWYCPLRATRDEYDFKKLDGNLKTECAPFADKHKGINRRSSFTA